MICLLNWLHRDKRALLLPKARCDFFIHYHAHNGNWSTLLQYQKLWWMLIDQGVVLSAFYVKQTVTCEHLFIPAVIKRQDVVFACTRLYWWRLDLWKCCSEDDLPTVPWWFLLSFIPLPCSSLFLQQGVNHTLMVMIACYGFCLLHHTKSWLACDILFVQDIHQHYYKVHDVPLGYFGIMLI